MKKKIIEVTATELRRQWGSLSEQANKGHHIIVTTNGRATHALMDYDDYWEMKGIKS